MADEGVEQRKVSKVMGEFGKGDLKSSSGETVTDPKQAQAIAFSEARKKIAGLRNKK
jgi:Family of unknown function (DUF6496)